MEYPFKDLLPLDEVLEREGYYKDWTHLDPEVFYSLTQISKYIKTKGYGVDVRLLIAQLAEHFGLKTTQVIDLANLLQQKFNKLEGVTQSFTDNINSLVAQMEADKNAVIANATVDSEVILARGGNATLGERLDNTTAQLEQIESVQPLYFDGTINLGDVIENAVENKNKKIKIPAGTYVIDETIAVNLKTIDIEIEGEGSTEGHAKTRLLWRGGAGTMFNLTGVRYIEFKNIEISGSIPGDAVRIVSGATGIKADGVIHMENVVFMGFETLVDYGGGFYHKFINCQFRYFKLGFDNVNAFNFNFSLCRFTDFESIIRVIAGTGALTFNMCSVEAWTGIAINCVAGSRTLVNFVNGYIENYPGKTPPTGLVGDYTQSTLIYGGGVINIENNAIITSGIKRVVYGSSATEKITSVGNSIRYNSLGSLEFYIYNPVNVKNVFTNDYAREGGLSQPQTNVASYIASDGRINSNYRYAYDAFENKFIKKGAFEPTLNQGWVNGNSNVEKLGVIVENGTVVFRGVAKNEDVASKTITTLPIGYRPSKQVYLPIITTRGNISVLWIYPDGRLFINDMTGMENQTIIFNGLSYEL